MKLKTSGPRKAVTVNEPIKTTPETTEASPSASGRWSAIQRTRLPHKVGLPLSSGGGGDGAGK